MTSLAETPTTHQQKNSTPAAVLNRCACDRWTPRQEQIDNIPKLLWRVRLRLAWRAAREVFFGNWRSQNLAVDSILALDAVLVHEEREPGRC